MSRLTVDARALDGLRAQAKQDPDTALKAAATQFEALFARALLKSMRDALPQNDPLASDATRMAQSLHDEQLAQKIAERGLGLAQMIVKQLSGRAASHGVSSSAKLSLAEKADSAARAGEGFTTRFVSGMLPHARAAAAQTGVPAKFILGQAALESGWGAREIRGADGAPSHNLFGVKAGAGWKGATVEVATTEYAGGIPRRAVERFRAYGSYAEAFADYARLLRGSARYAGVLGAARDAESFANSLQRAGYATDPRYAEKLARVIDSAPLRGVTA